MSKLRRSLPFFLIVSITLVFLIPNAVYASPGTSTVDARPTANLATGGLVGNVNNPLQAYDNNLGTSANFKYDAFAAGTFEVKTFSKPSSNVIVSVDFKMNYEADSDASATYRIVYYVGTSGPVVLVAWTSAAHAQSTVTWSSQAEPNDGTWTWTDIGNIRVIVETANPSGGKAAYFDEYETWVTVTTYSYTTGTMFVDPASLNNPSSPFTVDINISNVEDLYGWEFKLYYNTTILSNSTVTEGAFLSSGGSTFFNVLNNTDTYNATHGRFWVTCTLLGHTAGVTGSGTLATVTLTVDGSGTTPLALEDTKLVGYVFAYSTLVQMTHNTTDGQVTIVGVPEFPFGVALEIALAGVVVYIWWKRKGKQTLKPLAPD